MRWSNNTIAPQPRNEAGWGHQVRSYVEGRGVKDLRTGVTGGLSATLDGDLDRFLLAALAQGIGRPRSPNDPMPE